MLRLFRLKKYVLDLCYRRCRRTLKCSNERLTPLSSSSVTVNAPLIIQQWGNYCPSVGGEKEKKQNNVLFAGKQILITFQKIERVEAGCGQTRAIWSGRLAEEKHLYWSHCVWVCVCFASAFVSPIWMTWLCSLNFNNHEITQMCPPRME